MFTDLFILSYFTVIIYFLKYTSTFWIIWFTTLFNTITSFQFAFQFKIILAPNDYLLEEVSIGIRSDQNVLLVDGMSQCWNDTYPMALILDWFVSYKVKALRW